MAFSHLRLEVFYKEKTVMIKKKHLIPGSLPIDLFHSSVTLLIVNRHQICRTHNSKSEKF